MKKKKESVEITDLGEAMDAVQDDGLMLGCVSDELLKDDDLCAFAVRENHMALGFVPPDRRDRIEDIVDAMNAVQEYPDDLRTVPEDLRTREVCFLAFPEDADGCAPDLLKYVPEKLRTREMCRAAVGLNGRCLEYVPDGLKTPELCMQAVSENWADNADDENVPLQWVPEALKTKELCLAAVRANGMQLRCVPEALKSEEMCAEACREFGWALEYVPDSRMTAEVCLAAAEAEGFDGVLMDMMPERIRAQIEAKEEPRP